MCHFPNTSSVWTLESVPSRCFNSSPFCRQGYVCISVCLNVDVSDCSMDTFWIHAFAHYVVHSLHQHAVIHAFKCMICIQHTRYRPIIVLFPENRIQSKLQKYELIIISQIMNYRLYCLVPIHVNDARLWKRILICIR